MTREEIMRMEASEAAAKETRLFSMEKAIIELQKTAKERDEIMRRILCLFPVPLYKRIYWGVRAFFRRLRAKELKRTVLRSGIEIIHR